MNCPICHQDVPRGNGSTPAKFHRPCRDLNGYLAAAMRATAAMSADQRQAARRTLIVAANRIATQQKRDTRGRFVRT